MNQLLRLPSFLSCRCLHTKRLKRSPPKYLYFCFLLKLITKNFSDDQMQIPTKMELYEVKQAEWTAPEDVAVSLKFF